MSNRYFLLMFLAAFSVKAFGHVAPTDPPQRPEEKEEWKTHFKIPLGNAKALPLCSSDGKTITILDFKNEVRRYDVASGKLVDKTEMGPMKDEPYERDRPWEGRVSDDGKYVVFPGGNVYSLDGKVAKRSDRPLNFKYSEFDGDSYPDSSDKFLTRGHRFFKRAHKSKRTEWVLMDLDETEPTEKLTLPSSPITFSPDGKFAILKNQKNYDLYEIETGKTKRILTNVPSFSSTFVGNRLYLALAEYQANTKSEAILEVAPLSDLPNAKIREIHNTELQDPLRLDGPFTVHSKGTLGRYYDRLYDFVSQEWFVLPGVFEPVPKEDPAFCGDSSYLIARTGEKELGLVHLSELARDPLVDKLPPEKLYEKLVARSPAEFWAAIHGVRIRGKDGEDFLKDRLRNLKPSPAPAVDEVAQNLKQLSDRSFPKRVAAQRFLERAISTTSLKFVNEKIVPLLVDSKDPEVHKRVEGLRRIVDDRRHLGTEAGWEQARLQQALAVLH